MSEEDYAPYHASLHPPYYYEPYGSSRTRAPTRPMYPLPTSLSERTGPLFGDADVAEGESDLVTGPAGMAIGELLVLEGRVLDEAGRPIPGTLVELWQANAAGRYRHPVDDRDVPLDPNFDGAGRCITDAEGRYRFVTIKPGPYPVPDTGNWWRPPHIHFSLFGPSYMTRMITQMYFPGDPLNERDNILSAISDEAARDRLIARFTPEAGRWEYSLGYTFDMVLRGRHATPFESRP